jgi:hypothetical protein
VVARKFGSETEDRRRRLGEEGVLLVAHGDGARDREERVGAGEGDATEVVVHRVVDVPHERDAVDEDALRVLPELHRAEDERAAVAAPRRLVVGEDAIERLRPARGVEILAGRRVERVVRRIARLHEPARGERLERGEDDEVVADDAAVGSREQVEVGVARPRPEAVLDVERRCVVALRQPEHLQIALGGAADGLLLVARAPRDDLRPHGLAAHVGAAEAVHRADLAVEGVAPRLHGRIPDEVGALLTSLDVREIRRPSDSRIDPRRAVGGEGDDEALVAQPERPDERDPQLRRIDVVVDAFLEERVDLPAAGVLDVVEHEARPVRVGRLAAEEEPVDEELPRARGVGERGGEPGHLRRVEDVDVRVVVGKGLAGIDRPEEASRLELVVLDLPLDRLQRAVADGEDAVADDVPLLLRGDRAEAHRSELADRLESVVPARDPARDEARGRELEGDVADLEALEDLVLASLVPDGDVVGGIELALRVVVHIDVDAVGDDAAGAHAELEVELRLEGAAAAGERIDDLRCGASLVAVALRLRLDARGEREAEIGGRRSERVRRDGRNGRAKDGRDGGVGDRGEGADDGLPPRRGEVVAHARAHGGDARCGDRVGRLRGQDAEPAERAQGLGDRQLEAGRRQRRTHAERRRERIRARAGTIRGALDRLLRGERGRPNGAEREDEKDDRGDVDDDRGGSSGAAHHPATAGANAG